MIQSWLQLLGLPKDDFEIELSRVNGSFGKLR